MKSIVELDIHAPPATVAELFADPKRSTEWMDDIASVEPVSGTMGSTGSQYRLVPRKGDMAFVGTVVTKNLPAESRIRLDGDGVVVTIRGTFKQATAGRTHFTSEEEFTFQGRRRKVMGFFSRWAIRKAHKRHMEAFKRFAELQT